MTNTMNNLETLVKTDNFRRTKIIATLGPSCRSLAKITKLMETGVNLVRLNMSHGDHDSHRLLVKHVRTASRRLNRHVAIIMDLCGPKIRTGKFPAGPISLIEGAEVIVTSRSVDGEEGLIPSQYRNIHKDVGKGDRILLDDGNMELIVEKIRETELICTVIQGGTLSNNKGMNLPDSSISVTSFTAKDKRDADLAMELGADYLALSFVRDVNDIETLRRYLVKHEYIIPIIAKIEKPEAITQIEPILKSSDAIMIARGDLGIELPAETVPLLQRNLVNLARKYDRPVIVATQMLDSMMTRSRPTRAEVGDVANAALSGADAVMLSGETASGKHPMLAVAQMVRIINEIEAHQLQNGHFGSSEFIDNTTHDIEPVREAIADAAAVITTQLNISAVVIPTTSGTTARIVVSARPLSGILGVCHDAVICRRMSLYWGVVPLHVKDADLKNWRILCERISAQCPMTSKGNTVLIISGFNEDVLLNEPVLKVLSL